MSIYYHNHGTVPIDMSEEGCALVDWDESFGEYQFAKHPKGFPVFLPPDQLDACDEYRESDPYGTEAELSDDWQIRRVDCTLDLVRKAVKRIQGTPKILDLGCGQGHITDRIKQTIPESEVAGLDYSMSAIEYAVDHFSGIDFAVANAYKPPYAESYFDIVVCNNLWEHVPDPLYMASKILHVTKPSGFLIISTPSRYRMDNLRNVILGKPVTFMSKHHVTEYSVGQVKEQCRFAGYEVIEVHSKKIKRGSLLARIAYAIVPLPLHITGSHHQLESTVFFLAQRV